MSNKYLKASNIQKKQLENALKRFGSSTRAKHPLQTKNTYAKEENAGHERNKGMLGGPRCSFGGHLVQKTGARNTNFPVLCPHS